MSTCLLGAVAAIAASCREPTEVILEVRTNLSPTDVREVAFIVGTSSAGVEQRLLDRTYTAVTQDITDDGFIGTLGVVPPSSGAGLSVIVVLAARGSVQTCSAPDYEGCIIARRRLQYLDGHTLVVPIFMSDRCLGVPCDAATTCRSATCVSADLTCTEGGCVGPASESPAPAAPRPPLDGSIADGANDAPSTDAMARDATDAPSDGGPTSSVVCSGGACSTPDRCCYNPLNEQQSCAPPDVVCLIDQQIIACDGPEDCPGKGCCYSAGGASCLAGPCLQPMCHTSLSCPPGQLCTGTIGMQFRYCRPP